MMSRRIVIAMFMVLALLGFVGPAGAQDLNRAQTAGPEGCADFLTQGEAQTYFENNGGTAGDDALNLDPDGNGIACDQNGVGPGGPSAGPEGCADFLTQAEAQTYFENGGGVAGDDVLNLDEDGNGIACDQPGVEPEGPSAGPEGCADFLTQAEAQTYFENGGGTAGDDVLNLDPDGNGIACDDSGTVTEDSGENAPVVSALPSTGSGGESQNNAFTTTVVAATSLVLAAMALAIRRGEVGQA